ncbi:MAG: hypothetical protein WC796_01205 [Candidatus Pacearchaeota archaeon]
MKLQKRLSRVYNGKRYYKYVIVIPEKEIKQAKLKAGDELVSRVVENEIRIKTKDN